MKRTTRNVGGVLVLAGLVWQAGAATPASGGNPYQAVVKRNAFHLNPLIPPPTVPETPATLPARIELQGITDGIFGKRQALVRILEPAKPGEQPKPRSLIMDEGERRGIITVKAINPKARTVTFDNAGREETLELTNAPSKFAGPVSVEAPRPKPTPMMPHVVAPTMPQHIPQQLSPEEQVVRMEVERVLTKEAVARGELPPLPPTELTPPGSTGMPPAPPAPGSN